MRQPRGYSGWALRVAGTPVARSACTLTVFDQSCSVHMVIHKHYVVLAIDEDELRGIGLRSPTGLEGTTIATVHVRSAVWIWAWAVCFHPYSCRGSSVGFG